MSVTDITHASQYDSSQARAAQASMLTLFATFQAADQALTYAQMQGTSPTAALSTARTNALTAFQTSAAALT
jgi:hypothetical protein